MKKINFFLAVFLLFLPVSSLCAKEEKIWVCYELIKEPLLDGKIESDPAWENIPDATGFVRLGAEIPATHQTFFRMGYTSDALYIGIKCNEPGMKEIIAKSRMKDMEQLWREDSIEMFLFPEGADLHYHQFIVNTIGSRYRSYKYKDNVGLGDWQAKTHEGEDYYSIEVRIPFKTLLVVIPKKYEKWTGNICRNNYVGEKEESHTTWAYLKRRFHEADNFGWFIFADKFSEKEKKRAVEAVVNIFKEKIADNLELVDENRNKTDEINKVLEKKSSLQEKGRVLLKDYEYIKKETEHLDSINQARILYEKSSALLKSSNALLRRDSEEFEEKRIKSLLESFFE